MVNIIQVIQIGRLPVRQLKSQKVGGSCGVCPRVGRLEFVLGVAVLTDVSA